MYKKYNLDLCETVFVVSEEDLDDNSHVKANTNLAFYHLKLLAESEPF